MPKNGIFNLTPIKPPSLHQTNLNTRTLHVHGPQFINLTFSVELVNSLGPSDAQSPEILAHQLDVLIDGVCLVSWYHVLGPNESKDGNLTAELLQGLTRGHVMLSRWNLHVHVYTYMYNMILFSLLVEMLKFAKIPPEGDSKWVLNDIL